MIQKNVFTMSSFIENYYPMFISLATTALGWIVFLHFPEVKLRSDIYSSAISISSILLGFLITTQSLLFAIDNSPVIQGLRQAGSYKKLSSYLTALPAVTRYALLFLVCLPTNFQDLGCTS